MTILKSAVTLLIENGDQTLSMENGVTGDAAPILLKSSCHFVATQGLRHAMLLSFLGSPRWEAANPAIYPQQMAYGTQANMKRFLISTHYWGYSGIYCQLAQ